MQPQGANRKRSAHRTRSQTTGSAYTQWLLRQCAQEREPHRRVRANGTTPGGNAPTMGGVIDPRSSLRTEPSPQRAAHVGRSLRTGVMVNTTEGMAYCTRLNAFTGKETSVPALRPHDDPPKGNGWSVKDPQGNLRQPCAPRCVRCTAHFGVTRIARTNKRSRGTPNAKGSLRGDFGG